MDSKNITIILILLITIFYSLLYNTSWIRSTPPGLNTILGWKGYI